MSLVDLRFVKHAVPQLYSRIQLAVETGTCMGKSTQKMARCFDQVITIELSDTLSQQSQQALTRKGYKNIRFMRGDSVACLKQVVPEISEDKPSFFFLDAHWSGDATVDWRQTNYWHGYGFDTAHLGAKGATPTAEQQVPLLAELEVIMTQCKSEAVILIDDMKLLPTQGKGLRNAAFPGEDWSHISREDIFKVVRPRLRYHFSKMSLNRKDEQLLLVLTSMNQSSQNPEITYSKTRTSKTPSLLYRLFIAGTSVLRLSISRIPQPFLKTLDKSVIDFGDISPRICIFNPGVVRENDTLIMVARAEKYLLADHLRNVNLIFNTALPLLVEADLNGHPQKIQPLDFDHGRLFNECNIEDMRLFRWRGHIYSNHAMVEPVHARRPEKHPFRLEEIRFSMAISKLDIQACTLSFVSAITVDFAVTQHEKNWVFFEKDDELYAIYSAGPQFIILKLQDHSTWHMQTHLAIHVTWPRLPFLYGDLRCSINPIIYDDKHFLCVIHKKMPGPSYVFWAVLLNRVSLRPAFIASIPLVRWHSPFDMLSRKLEYITSAIAFPERIMFFAGVNDRKMASASVERAELDSCWVSIDVT